jgi:tetratricopeptide (TPR) repeat protein
MDEVEMVKAYLRGMNMEQLGRIDEAIELYEGAVADRFDSTGPYDRLIALYAHRGRHRDVIRTAEAALQNVRTYDDKKVWYRRMRSEAEQAIQKVPRAIPKKQP